MGVRVLRTSVKGFTLIEVMIAVAIIAVLAVFAIPAYNKYMFDAREAEGVQILLSAYKDELRVRTETGSFTEYLEGAPVGQANLLYRAGNTSHFNLVVGKSGTPGKYAFKYENVDLGYPNVPKKVNDFGQSNALDGKFNIGVEADLKGDGTLHVLAINQDGQLQKVCDQWSGQTLSAWYTHDYGGDPLCTIPRPEDGDGGAVD